MYHILVSVDDAIDHVDAQIDAIQNFSAVPDSLTVTVLHVFTKNTEGASVHQIEAARHAEERLREAGIDVTLDERSGKPSEQVRAYADEHDVDQICVGGRKRSPTGKVLFGSVTQEVILDTTRPVLVCGAKKQA